MTSKQSAETDEAALDPAAMLALVDNQQRRIQSQRGGNVPTITLLWGLAWLLGFTALWLIDGARPAFALPLSVAVWSFASLMVIAFGASMWMGIRSSRGIRSSATSAHTGAVYGMTWTLGSIALGILGSALIERGMSPELANYFYPSAYVFFVGVMYLAAGAIWHSTSSAVAGAWLVIVAAVAPLIGYPNHYLVFAIAGGGCFLVLSILGFTSLRRGRRLGASEAASVARGGE